MERELLYKEVSKFMKGRWWDIFFIRLLYGVLTFLIMSTLVSTIFDPTWFSSLRFVSEVDPEALEDFFISVAASSAISTVMVGVVNGALTMTILKAYQNDASVRFSDVYRVIKSNFLKLLIALSLIAFIQFIVTLIPYVNIFSFIILPFINYLTIFTFFLLVDDKSLNGLTAITESIRHTQGHKYNLFRITLHYYLRKFVGYSIVLLGFIFITLGVILSEGSVSSSIFLMLGFAKVSIGISVNIFMAIKFGPYATVAHAIYYEQLKRA